MYFPHVRFRYLLRWKAKAETTLENEKSLDKEFSMLHMDGITAWGQGGGIEGHAPFSLPFTDDILMHWS